MTVKKLKSDKSEVESRVLSNNYIHAGTDHLFMYLVYNQIWFQCSRVQELTALCTTMMVETIQHYLEKGDNSVYLLLIDASKAFDKVSFEMFHFFFTMK